MEKLTCVSISIEDKTIQITPESTPRKQKNGVNDIKNGIDGVKISRTKEQVQIEKLLQAIEKNPFATQAYYAEQIGVSKRTVSRIFVSLQQNGVLVQNGTNRKSNWVIIK